MANYTSYFSSNMSTISEFAISANTATGGYLIWSFVGVMAIALFFLSLPYGRSKAAALSTFITGIVLITLNRMGLVEWWVLALDALVFGASIILIMINKKR